MELLTINVEALTTAATIVSLLLIYIRELRIELKAEREYSRSRNQIIQDLAQDQTETMVKWEVYLERQERRADQGLGI